MTLAVAIQTLLLAAAGVGGGFLVSKSELLQDWQARWDRAADLLDAALHDEIAVWEEAWHANPDPNVSKVPWGMVDGDRNVLPEISGGYSRQQRARLWVRWAWNAMLRCNVCSGWHVIELLLAAMVLWAIFDADQSGWDAVTVAPVVWLAAGAVHTVVTGVGNNKEIW